MGNLIKTRFQARLLSWKGRFDIGSLWNQAKTLNYENLKNWESGTLDNFQPGPGCQASGRLSCSACPNYIKQQSAPFPSKRPANSNMHSGVVHRRFGCGGRMECGRGTAHLRRMKPCKVRTVRLRPRGFKRCCAVLQLRGCMHVFLVPLLELYEY